MGSTLAANELIKTRLHVNAKLLPRLIAVLQEPERLTDHLAGGLVQAALNLLVHESFELRRERNVHRNPPSPTEAKGGSELCQYLT